MDSALTGAAAGLLAGLAAGIVVVLAWGRRLEAAPDRPDLARAMDDFRRELHTQVGRLEETIRRLKEAVAEAERTRAELAALSARVPAAPEPAPPPVAADPLHARVWRLRDEGRDAAFIARETGLDAGEVELILGLRGLSPSP